MVSWHAENNHLIEDTPCKRNWKAVICCNHERHIPPVSLLLRHKMVAVCCLVWPLVLRVWLVRQADQIQALTILKILYLAACQCFLVYCI